jgi:hypothetical protein
MQKNNTEVRQKNHHMNDRVWQIIDISIKIEYWQAENNQYFTIWSRDIDPIK